MTTVREISITGAHIGKEAVMTFRDEPTPSLTADTTEILAALPDTVVQLDPRGCLLAVNRTDAPVFSSTPRPGERLEAVFDPNAAALIAGLMQTAARTGVAEGEFAMAERSFRVIARPLRSAPSTLLVFQDLTVRRNAERALTESIGDKTNVLKAISQQLGAPLISVLGYASLLTESDPELDAATRDAMAQHMTDQAWELAGMVENLQTMAQTELGDLRVVRVPVNLSAAVAQVIDSMGPRGTKITITGNRTAVGVGDPARVQQVIRNLLSNALSHGAEPITVDVARDETGAKVSVKDRGQGLPERLERDVFSGDPKLTTSEGSSRAGIGLWAAQELASLMDGEIEYAREHGLTVFRLIIPVV